MNYPTVVQSLTGGTRCQSAPSVSETKQGNGAAQHLRGQSPPTVSSPATASGPTCSTEQCTSNDLGGGSEGVEEHARHRP